MQHKMIFDFFINKILAPLKLRYFIDKYLGYNKKVNVKLDLVLNSPKSSL